MLHFCLLAFGDIRMPAKGAQRVAADIAPSITMQEKPAIVTIFVAQAILELVAGRKSIEVVLQGDLHNRQIFRVDELTPVVIGIGEFSIT